MPSLVQGRAASIAGLLCSMFGVQCLSLAGCVRFGQAGVGAADVVFIYVSIIRVEVLAVMCWPVKSAQRRAIVSSVMLCIPLELPCLILMDVRSTTF